MEVIVRAEDILTFKRVEIHLDGEEKEAVLITIISLSPYPHFFRFQFLSSSTFSSYLSLYSYLEKEIVPFVCCLDGSIPSSGQSNTFG